jgi:hypothetical protein
VLLISALSCVLAHHVSHRGFHDTDHCSLLYIVCIVCHLFIPRVGAAAASFSQLSFVSQGQLCSHRLLLCASTIVWLTKSILLYFNSRSPRSKQRRIRSSQWTRRMIILFLERVCLSQLCHQQTGLSAQLWQRHLLQLICRSHRLRSGMAINQVPCAPLARSGPSSAVAQSRQTLVAV